VEELGAGGRREGVRGDPVGGARSTRRSLGQTPTTGWSSRLLARELAYHFSLVGTPTEAAKAVDYARSAGDRPSNGVVRL
jgi:hypothetical protein